jgi:hypothetical protein
MILRDETMGEMKVEDGLSKMGSRWFLCIYTLGMRVK